MSPNDATFVANQIGQHISLLDTPALLVDLNVLDTNIARISATCRNHGVAWRPHIKGNKTVEIIRREIAAGAIGITCAKLGEAEVLGHAGIKDILIANQIVGAAKVARLVALRREVDVKVAVDSVANCAPIAQAACAAGVTIGVVIEVNIGMNRAGVEPGDATVALANAIAALPGVRLVGVMGWESHAVTIADPDEKARVVAAAIGLLTSSAQACRKAGHRIDIVSCGGSGTFPHCAAQPGVTEVQAGGAIFSDMRYRNLYHLDFAPALLLLATVNSRPTPLRVVLDAGKKAMSSDGAMPALRDLTGVAKLSLSAEHATITLEAPSDSPAVGDKVVFIVGYGDTTVHLHEDIVAIRDDHVEAIWPVSARGRIK
jgi:D-serine deaminase-like pyridoxal phosphate-dependent protein